MKDKSLPGAKISHLTRLQRWSLHTLSRWRV